MFDKHDRTAFPSVIDWSKYRFQNSAGQSIIFNKGRQFPIRPYRVRDLDDTNLTYDNEIDGGNLDTGKQN